MGEFIHLNNKSIRGTWRMKWNKLSCSGIKINKLPLTPIFSVSKARFKFRNQPKQLPQFRSSIIYWVENNIISMYSIITDMIIGKTIDVSNRKNVGLSMKRNLNINRTLWQKPFLLSFLLTEERRLLRHSFLAIDLSLLTS